MRIIKIEKLLTQALVKKSRINLGRLKLKLMAIGVNFLPESYIILS
jgi:hypothetical protein